MRVISIRALRNIALYFLVMFCSVAVVNAETPAEKGRKIMESIDALPQMEKMITTSTLNIFDTQGKKLFSKKSRSATFNDNFRDVDNRTSRMISYFYAPADDKGNGALVIENKNQDDDQWIYLKGLRKPKRVIGSDKSSSYMGSDFSNGDVGSQDIDDFNYNWLAVEKVSFKAKGIPCHKIEAVFKDKQKQEDYGYSKSTLWVHPKSGLTFKMDLFNMSGQLYKQARLISFLIVSNRDGKRVYIPTSIEMKNVIKGTKTVMKLTDINTGKNASKIRSSIFKTDYLTRKWW